jgi:hypothetical protein
MADCARLREFQRTLNTEADLRPDRLDDASHAITSLALEPSDHHDGLR